MLGSNACCTLSRDCRWRRALLMTQAWLHDSLPISDPHLPPPKLERQWLGGRFGYILFFLLGGGAKGVRGAGRGGGEGFLWKIPGVGGAVFRAGGGGGWEGVCGEFWGGGGLNIFFRGRNSHQGGETIFALHGGVPKIPHWRQWAWWH